MASIVRVGASNDTFGQQLTEALEQYLGSSSSSNNNNSSSGNPSTNPIQSNATSLPISNRYFNATVNLCPLSVLPSTTAATATIESSSNNNNNNEDGMILIFDNASNESFDTLASLHGMAETNGQNGDLLRLCVGLVIMKDTTIIDKSSKAYEEEYSRRVIWCLDHGYEFVEGVTIESPEDLQRGHDAREKEGFARVVEALQGTVWSSAIMHTQTKQKLQQSYQETREEATTTTVTNNNVNINSSSAAGNEETKNEYEPPPPSISLTEVSISDQESQAREEKARKALLEQDALVEDANNDGGNDDDDEEEIKQERQADRIMSQMESALAEATRIRSLSQQGALSDEDRKQRAGDAAMLLMNLMNQMGGDSEDDESDSDDGE